MNHTQYPGNCCEIYRYCLPVSRLAFFVGATDKSKDPVVLALIVESLPNEVEQQSKSRKSGYIYGE